MGIRPTEVAHGWNIAEWVAAPASSVLRPVRRACGTSRRRTPSDTLLGPEGSGRFEHLAPPRWRRRCSRCLSFRPAGAPRGAAPEGRSRFPQDRARHGTRENDGLRAARTLRTAQWTRASKQIFCGQCGQVTKSAWWMPWHQEPMKDVVACEKPRGAGKRAVIRGCPNGETRLESCPVTLA